MTSKIKFENISLIDNGIILSLKSPKKEELIYFSEIDKVYIKKNKIQPIYYYLFISSSSMFILILLFINFKLDIILIVPILVIMTVVIKLNSRKIYALKIRLKDGRFFRQEVPLKLKYKTIEIVSIIRHKIYAHTINN